jgi:hypothetical protein
VSDLTWHFFVDELTKIAANRPSDILRVPGMVSGTPKGLAKPARASGQNLAKFQAAGPSKALVTGSSPTAHNPTSTLSAGTTGFVGMPAPPPVE